MIIAKVNGSVQASANNKKMNPASSVGQLPRFFSEEPPHILTTTCWHLATSSSGSSTSTVTKHHIYTTWYICIYLSLPKVSPDHNRMDRLVPGTRGSTIRPTRCITNEERLPPMPQQLFSGCRQPPILLCPTLGIGRGVGCVNMCVRLLTNETLPKISR